MQAVDPNSARRPHPHRQDTFDLRDQIHADDHNLHMDSIPYNSTSDEEHSVLEDDSDTEEREVDYMDEDDDGSSSLSIPNESIDFDLVYSLHSFAATVEGQANVVKGDSLFLMDDSNSYWWLVRVLKTQEVGYIPAENIETPFERLARLNKHRNVDLASATQAELQEDLHASRDRLRNNLSSRSGSNLSSSPSPVPPGSRGDSRLGVRSQSSKGVAFTPALSVHRYPPAVWGEEEEEEEDVEWDDEGYEDEDPDLAEDQYQQQQQQQQQRMQGDISMEPDDGMRWDDAVAEDMQARHAHAQAQAHAAQMQAKIALASASQLQQPVADPRQLEQGGDRQAVNQPTQSLRPQNSRERLAPAVQIDAVAAAEPVAPKPLDPAQVTETRKISATPSIVRDTVVLEHQQPASAQTPPQSQPPPQVQIQPQAQVQVQAQPQSQSPSNGPLLPSDIMRKQDEERKRTREEIVALEEAARKKAKPAERASSVSSNSSVRTSGSQSGGGKLRKDRDTTDDESTKEKKKRGGMFNLWRKKDKKDKATDSGTTDIGRSSEESGRSSSHFSITNSNETAISLQQQSSLRNSTDPKRIAQSIQPIQQLQPPPQVQPQPQPQPQPEIQPQPEPQQQTPQAPSTPPSAQVSQHASQLRQRDLQQQELYQQYLNRSPSSPPEAQPSYGLQSFSAVMPASASYNASGASAAALGPPTSRPRPTSLVLTPSSVDGQGVGVPELSVIRIFAGNDLQTEATFKTVLLNASTTSSDLVRQAIQRFRLPSGEEEKDYYLTIKQVEGSSAVLLPGENPLRVFETLVEAALELPKVKRSSVGSISSVASNLSLHPAIKKLPMNDFTDDSAVKFYLNRRGEENGNDSIGDDDETLLADISHSELSDSQISKPQYLAVSTAAASTNVTPERFSSPSFRFALQLIIYPDDLPDDMIFDPQTEAIVFKDTLRDRPQAAPSPGVSHNLRRKIFVFPKNVTVAEVIELGLERFGILEGVVDGGDEVEDKHTKRRSTIRVRYGLAINTGIPEKELSPSSKVIEAFSRPPTYRAVERRFPDSKRRSVDSTQLLGSLDDVNPDDPVFVLRRAKSYRNSASRHRVSAPLDEIALQHLHRESASGSSLSSDGAAQNAEDHKAQRQLSRQEIIAAQRAASRANQRAILSAQTNSVRGMDVLLPGNAMIRSSRYEVGDKMRYSYVEPDGETFDISDIVEEEWSESKAATRNDLLEGVIVRNKEGLGEKLDRVLNKIKDGKANARAHASQMSSGSTLDSSRSVSPSEYSLADQEGGVEPSNSRSATPTVAGLARTPTPNAVNILSSQREAASSPANQATRPRTNTPTASSTKGPSRNRQPSIASVMSDLSGYATPTQLVQEAASALKPQRQQPLIPKDDFGLSQMLAIIEISATLPKPPVVPLDPVEEMLFGKQIDLNSLHPQARDIYASSFKQLQDMDKTLDELLRASQKF